MMAPEDRRVKLSLDTAQIWIPDGSTVEEALARTTHMGIAAHQDDLEIMAVDGILRAFQRTDAWFSGVVVTDGAGSPRDGLYLDFTDHQMREVRRQEQRKAGLIGDYSAVALLDHRSAVVKDKTQTAPADDIRALVLAARPRVVYTHNLADKHDTHVAVALRTLEAIRAIPREARPEKLYGGEVWRDLDWLLDEDKVAFDTSAHENILSALVSVFDSQICGGKRYDLATAGRRRAHATYSASHGVDTASSITYALDLTPLIRDDSLDPWDFLAGYIERFSGDIRGRLRKHQADL
jgi:LmbE family N-acetylglucosaminyl deacetylase